MPDGAVTIKIPRAITLANVLSCLGVAAVATMWGAKIDAGYTKHAVAITALTSGQAAVSAEVASLKIHRDNDLKFQERVIAAMQRLEDITTKTQVDLARLED